MNANVIYDFDDVINIVNERHEHCRYHDHVRAEHKKERERQHKERIHDLNKHVLHWLANGSYFIAGGVFAMSIAFAALDKVLLSCLVAGGAAIAAMLALYFERKEQQF